MAWLLIIAGGLGVLYLWLTGHWFGWVLAAPPVWLVIQFLLQNPADTSFDKLMRAIIVFAAMGLPCWFWGSIAKRGV